MKISLNWLNDYIDLKDYLTRANELAALITAAGIEVEGIQDLSAQYNYVVIGEILKKDQHPNADRLTVCQVATGDGVVHQIVCGARNHNAGDRIVVGLPGAVLPVVGSEPLTIKQSQIRGVDSSGMLCSEKELGLKAESEGILLLPPTAPVGQSFAKYMGFDDVLFELKVTPNRADCLSHFGLAREISAILNRETRFPIESLIEDGGSTRSVVKVELRDAELCPRYDGRGVAGVKVGPSPAWLRTRLEAVGLKSINNVVDVTNFVMMELGQPLHAFDLREIKGGKITIERARKGEDFTTLDGTKLKLEGEELTIRDAERPVALAGIVGGQNSGINDSTTNIFLEAAYFAPSSVRRTARKFNVETDSSYRFARGTNPEAVPLALNRAALLIQKVAGGKIMGEAIDEYPKSLTRQPVEISAATVEARLGYKVDPAAFVDWMKRLGCTIEPLAGQTNTWRVLPPLFRWDLAIDMDLVEEYARLAGYQHIPETLPALTTMPLAHDPLYLLENRVRRLLQGQGCLQAINYAFISQTFQDRILGELPRLREAGLETTDAAVSIVNPLNEELNVMRKAVLPGLIKNVMHNSRQSNSHGCLFENGHSHVRVAGSGISYSQEARLAFAFWGTPTGLWAPSKPTPLVYSLKGTIETLLRSLGFANWTWDQLSAKQAPEFLHPGQAARLILNGKSIGVIGTLHPSLADELKIREVTAVAELSLDKIAAAGLKSPQYRPISKMPAVERDLAFVMPKHLPVTEVELEIRAAGGEWLKELAVFDVFEGGNLPADKRSVAFRLLFQSIDRTLEEQQINTLRDAILSRVGEKFGIALR